jgi:hypothetical protein
MLILSRRGAAKRTLIYELREAKGLESPPTIEIKNQQNLNHKKRSQTTTENIFCSSSMIPYKNFFRSRNAILESFRGILE